ncbi:uncharacterized protein DSM5745_02521 [Aspergillus mulundensis]|uniref:AB hydrolase-1 domain-containing protein n=1 Tax=Aspergillus mulundensis TaxID=1810919 RepID=A0A3D8SWR8_9EURO|nr:Uncharacterized protein DSM5745_02521 [Aspergillus mulundensis]RDW90746.1 Uncharacterized protein DSM5745_02521 [Aspergillus mulundensis]
MRLTTALRLILLAATAHAKVASEWLQTNHKEGDPPPSGKVDNDQLVILSGSDNVSRGSDAVNEPQPSSCPTIMIGTAEPDGDMDDGWKELPTVAGFDLTRLVVDDDANATLPYFLENTKDFSNIKRAVITIPGKARNSWQSANDMRNALVCAAGRESVNADMDAVLIAAPQWLSDKDVDAGAGASSDVWFDNSSYQQGAAAIGPGDVSISAYEAMDMLVNTFWNKDVYPALETVVVASHSLGAQMTQRYAMLRTPQPQDSNLSFGIMNPGSYAWPVSDRPDTDDSCENSYNSWPYGLDDNDTDAFPSYVTDALRNRSAIRERFFSKTIFYGYGLDDHGDGDTHCEAQWQGSTHLGRGRNFVDMLGDLEGGFPGLQEVEYVEGVAHEEYLMFVSEAVQRRIFLFDETAGGTGNSTNSTGSDGDGDGDGDSDGSDDGDDNGSAHQYVHMPGVLFGSLLVSVVAGLYA